jgi:hypothetical protein
MDVCNEFWRCRAGHVCLIPHVMPVERILETETDGSAGRRFWSWWNDFSAMYRFGPCNLM